MAKTGILGRKEFEEEMEEEDEKVEGGERGLTKDSDGGRWADFDADTEKGEGCCDWGELEDASEGNATRRQSTGVGESDNDADVFSGNFLGVSMGNDAACRIAVSTPEVRRRWYSEMSALLRQSKFATPKRRNLWLLTLLFLLLVFVLFSSSSRVKEGDRFSPVKLILDRLGL